MHLRKARKNLAIKQNMTQAATEAIKGSQRADNLVNSARPTHTIHRSSGLILRQPTSDESSRQIAGTVQL